MSAAFIDGFLASDAGGPFAGIRQDAHDILTAFLEVAERGPGDLDPVSIEAALVSVVPRMKKHRLADGPGLFGAFIEYAGTTANLKDAGPLADQARRRAAELATEDAKQREPVRVESPRPGRNDPCPCGSGKKFKKCCGSLRKP